MNSNSNSNSVRKEIVDKADIVNIVSQYVKLEKRGNNYIGLCPFHDDKNPSMSVSPQKKVFKCFSCGTAGDVITFVGRLIKLNFHKDEMKLVMKFRDFDAYDDFRKDDKCAIFGEFLYYFSKLVKSGKLNP